jgi:hypothetical protein
MPLVRCPDCSRDIEVSKDDLAGIIVCAVCEARFGPLIRRPGTPVPPPPVTPATDFEDAGAPWVDPLAPRLRRKRVQPKSVIRFLPILLGVLIGLGGTAAVAGAIYAALKYGRPAGAPEALPKSPAQRQSTNPAPDTARPPRQ